MPAALGLQQRHPHAGDRSPYSAAAVSSQRPQIVGEAAAEDELEARLVLDLADEDRRLGETALRALADGERPRMRIDGAALRQHIAYARAVQLQRVWSPLTSVMATREPRQHPAQLGLSIAALRSSGVTMNDRRGRASTSVMPVHVRHRVGYDRKPSPSTSLTAPTKRGCRASPRTLRWPRKARSRAMTPASPGRCVARAPG